MSKTLGIYMNNERVGEVDDTNEFELNTDEECLKLIDDLLEFPLSSEEKEFLQQTKSFFSSKVDADIDFTITDILFFSRLCDSIPSRAAEITTLSSYIIDSLEIDGDFSDNCFLEAACAFASLVPDGKEPESETVEESLQGLEIV